MTLGNVKIDQVDSFTYLGSIISKNDGSSEGVKSRIDKAQVGFSWLKEVWKNRKISLQMKTRILEATVVKYRMRFECAEKQMKMTFSKEIVYRLLWIPNLLTVFQALGSTKRLVQS